MTQATYAIRTTRELTRFLQQAREAGRLALDTEFVWTRTFYPCLGLIQVAVSADCVGYVDVLEIDDLSPLGDILSDPGVVKILHDVPSDLPILLRVCAGVRPGNLFDTRLAAGFCGMTATLSLVSLIEQLIGVSLPKTQTRTNWCKRPLTAEQIRYALDDVRYLPRAMVLLTERVAAAGNMDFLTEELEAIARPGNYGETEPREAYLRIRGHGRLNPRQRAVLRELAAWREDRARKRDISRGWVLSDGTLLQVARQMPADTASLAIGDTPDRRQLERFAEAIVRAVRRGRDCPRESLPHGPPALADAKTIRTITDQILRTARVVAEKRLVDPTVVMTRKGAASLAVAARHARWRDHWLLTGWRGEVLRDALAPQLTAAAATPPATESATPG